MLRMADHSFCNYVDQPEKFGRCILIISKIQGAGVYCVISYHSHHIEGFLDDRIQTFLNQTRDVGIEVLPSLPEMAT